LRDERLGRDLYQDEKVPEEELQLVEELF